MAITTQLPLLDPKKLQLSAQYPSDYESLARAAHTYPAEHLAQSTWYLTEETKITGRTYQEFTDTFPDWVHYNIA